MLGKKLMQLSKLKLDLFKLGIALCIFRWPNRVFTLTIFALKERLGHHFTLYRFYRMGRPPIDDLTAQIGLIQNIPEGRHLTIAR